jgi:uncharacterized protein YjiS (DUF1127 family)
MSTTFEHTSVPVSGVLARVEHAFEIAVSPLRTYLRRRAAYRQIVAELSGYSDRNLADLGIARYEIERLAREGARLG